MKNRHENGSGHQSISKHENGPKLENISEEEIYMTKCVMFMNGLLDVLKAAKDISKDVCKNEASKTARDEIKKRLVEITECFND